MSLKTFSLHLSIFHHSQSSSALIFIKQNANTMIFIIKSTNLKQFISTQQSSVDSNRTVWQDGTYVMVGSHLHPILYVYRPLQADPQTPALTKLRQLGNLEKRNELLHDKTNYLSFVFSQDSDQPGQAPSLVNHTL